MKPTQVAKNAARAAFEPLETLKSQVAQPMLEEAASELGSFFGAKRGVGKNPQVIAHEELQRARNRQKIEEMDNEDNQNSEEKVSRLSAEIHAVVQNEYSAQENRSHKEQTQLKEELGQLQSEVAKLAKSAGVETKAHLETIPKKVGVLDIKRLTSIIRYLRIKVEESKSAKELVSQRTNAKRTTGMLAWVSGKQMKVYEQGTLQLQG